MISGLHLQTVTKTDEKDLATYFENDIVNIQQMTTESTPRMDEKLSMNQELESLLNKDGVTRHQRKRKTSHHHKRPRAAEQNTWHSIRRSLSRSSLTRNDLIYIVDFLLISQPETNTHRGKRFRPLPQGI